MTHTMGFDLNIRAVLSLCSDTGKPYYYMESSSRGLSMRIYDLSTLSIPKEHRRFLKQRGSIFHAYTSCVFDEEIITVTITDFLEKYPPWEAVKAYDEENTYWTETDHNEFKKALEWFDQDSIQYTIDWSY